MKAVLFPLAVLASVAAAASGSSDCAADYIVESCLDSENSQLAGCGNEQYDCKCNAYKNIVTCFNNCPNDERRSTYEGQVQIFCGYATQFATTTTAASGKPTASGGGSGSTKTTEAAGGVVSKSSGTPTGTGPESTKTNNAADLAYNAGGVLAAVAGVVAAVL